MISNTNLINYDPVKELRFKYSWRPYQKRVLDSIHEHLKDHKLHIVAAPGSGKTVLGLEVFRLLGEPALVLSPTRIIRDQWIERLNLFLDSSVSLPLNWVSDDFDKLAFFNSLTYQRLYSESEIEDISVDNSAPTKRQVQSIIKKLSDANITTIIIDEAHHLRAAWWDVLIEIIENLQNATLVCLTATPPYDSSGKEWLKYTQLCGPIDEEISIPELVRENNLCPHQDYIYVTEIDKATSEAALNHKNQTDELLAQFQNDPLFQFSVENHHVFTAEEVPIDDVLSNVTFVIALLAFLKGCNKVVPFRVTQILELEKVPPLDTLLWEVLLKEYLFGNGWPQQEVIETHKKEVTGKLRTGKLLWKHEINLDVNKIFSSGVQHSSSKVSGILQIVIKEHEIRLQSLRQVILCDHIQRDVSVDDVKDGKLTLGAWPVFVAIATSLPADISQRFALVTGNFCIVPVSVVNELHARKSINSYNYNELDELKGFYVLSGVSTSYAVVLMTELLCAGYINGIVGTTALLGEGWDAPCVNSLILGGYANSYVLTNQSRGRAIRVDPTDAQKFASIWHLLAIGGFMSSDLDDMSKRFRGFPGISVVDEKIENSIERIGLPSTWSQATIYENNEKMFTRIANSKSIQISWENALINKNKRLTPVVIHKSSQQTGNVYKRSKPKSIRNYILLFCVIVIILFVLCSQVCLLGSIPFTILLTGGVLFFRLLIKRNRMSPDADAITAMGSALLGGLCEIKEIKGGGVKVVVTENTSNEICASLEGGSFYEKNIFSNCLEEILAPIENPRYIVSRGCNKKHVADYHNVPSIFAQKKESALIFHKWWSDKLGRSKLLYTRTDEGRLIILKARAHAIANKTQGAHQIRNRWI